MSHLSDMSENIFLQNPSLEWHLAHRREFAGAILKDILDGPDSDMEAHFIIDDYIIDQIKSNPRTFINCLADCLLDANRGTMYSLLLNLTEFVNLSPILIDNKIIDQHAITERNEEERNRENNYPRDRYGDERC